MRLAITILHIVVTLVLVATVLLQSGKQQGLSGSIAGGAETFFGKNKGRTIDGLLNKLTTVMALLFIITSIALSLFLTAPAPETTESGDVTPPISIGEDIDLSEVEEGEGDQADGDEVPAVPAP